MITQYEDQLKIQRNMSINPKYSHSKEHRDMMRNIEMLLTNISKINDAITEIALYQENNITEHLKKALHLEDIKPIKQRNIK